MSPSSSSRSLPEGTKRSISRCLFLVDCGEEFQRSITADINEVGELVTLYRFGKSGVDAEGYGTQDDNYTPVPNVRAVFRPGRGTVTIEEEGMSQIKEYLVQLLYTQEAGIKDMILRGDGNKYIVTEYFERRDFNRIICKFVRVQNYPIITGSG